MIRHLVAQVRFFQARKDEVQLILSAPARTLPRDLASLVADPAQSLPPSRLYIYHDLGADALLASLRQRDKGLVLIHDHRAPFRQEVEGNDRDYQLAAHYADLCLVDDPRRRAQLLDEYGLPPERVYLMPGVDREGAYRAALSELVEQALADNWPPAAQSETAPVGQEPASSTSAGRAAVQGGLKVAQSQADVMLRDYRVRSRIPLLGGLVAWVRRNLTSHLREPYLDPILERQVVFNRSVVTWMEQIQARLEGLEAEIQRLQDDAERRSKDDRAETR
jgi:hypothetical protein